MASANLDPQIAKLLSALSPETLRTLNAGSPPPGITADFENPTTQTSGLVGIGSTFLVIASTCYIIRIYTKAAILRQWTWDDLVITLGFALSLVCFGFVLTGVIHGPLKNHLWELHLDSILGRLFYLVEMMLIILPHPCLGLIKGALYIQYYQIFHQLRWMRIAIWVGAILHCIFYALITIVACALGSRWRSDETHIDYLVSTHLALFTRFFVPIGVIGMIDDWYLLILPIPAVIGLQMGVAKKIGIIALFATGALATIASTLGVAYRLVGSAKFYRDLTWYLGRIWMMSQIEMFGGITVSCMPSVTRCWRHTHGRPWAQSLKLSVRQLFSRSSRNVKSSDCDTRSSTDQGRVHREVFLDVKIPGPTITVTRDSFVVREPNEV